MSRDESDECEFLESLPPLVRAAASGDLPAVRAVLDAGTDVGDSDQDGWTALHAAATRRHPEAVEALPAAGADPNATNDGFSVLLNAAGPGDAASVRLLLQAGATVRARHPSYGWTPLSRAAEWCNIDVVQLLVSAGADVEENAPLIAAAESGCDACVEVLLAAGATPPARRDGTTEQPLSPT
jgi:uncharacterized protein